MVCPRPYDEVSELGLLHAFHEASTSKKGAPFLLGTKLLTWIRSDEFNPILSRKIEELPEPSRTRSYDAAVSSKVERLYGATADARGHALTPWHGAPVSASAQVPAPVASREPPRALEEMQRRRFSRRHDRMCVLFKSCLIFRSVSNCEAARTCSPRGFNSTLSFLLLSAVPPATSSAVTYTHYKIESTCHRDIQISGTCWKDTAISASDSAKSDPSAAGRHQSATKAHARRRNLNAMSL